MQLANLGTLMQARSRSTLASQHVDGTIKLAFGYEMLARVCYPLQLQCSRRQGCASAARASNSAVHAHEHKHVHQCRYIDTAAHTACHSIARAKEAPIRVLPLQNMLAKVKPLKTFAASWRASRPRARESWAERSGWRHQCLTLQFLHFLHFLLLHSACIRCTCLRTSTSIKTQRNLCCSCADAAHACAKSLCSTVLRALHTRTAHSTTRAHGSLEYAAAAPMLSCSARLAAPNAIVAASTSSLESSSAVAAPMIAPRAAQKCHCMCGLMHERGLTCLCSWCSQCNFMKAQSAAVGSTECPLLMCHQSIGISATAAACNNSGI